MSTTTLELSAHRQPSIDQAEIRALIEGLHQAHHHKDAAAIAAPYTEDAAVFSLAPPLAHRGVDVHEKQAWLDTWQGPVEFESRDLHITVSGDLAFGHGFLQLSGTKTSGRPVRFWMRATVCLERSAAGWRIVHEHLSVPFYMDDSVRPAFDLRPPSPED